MPSHIVVGVGPMLLYLLGFYRTFPSVLKFEIKAREEIDTSLKTFFNAFRVEKRYVFFSSFHFKKIIIFQLGILFYACVLCFKSSFLHLQV